MRENDQQTKGEPLHFVRNQRERQNIEAPNVHSDPVVLCSLIISCFIFHPVFE